MPEFKIALGIGLKIFLIVVSVGAVFYIGYYQGGEIEAAKLKQANVEVLMKDSKEAQKIRTRTKELQNEADEWIKHNNPYNADGSPTDEWLQFIQRQESISKQRGNRSNIFR